MENNYNFSKELLSKADILYEFVDRFNAYENTTRDYGGNDNFSMSEVHILAAIDQNPGVLTTDLANKLRKTKGFISQVTTKFEKMGYIVKAPMKNNAKNKQLFTTSLGRQLCEAHSEFDERTLLKTYNYLLRDCTPDEISSFYKVMEVYNNIMEAGEEKRKRLALLRK